MKNTTVREATPPGCQNRACWRYERRWRNIFGESDGSTGYENGRRGRIFTAPEGYAARAVNCGVVNEPISVEKIA